MRNRVYFIRPIGIVGPIKIGHSVRPHERHYQFSAWSPFPLEIAVTVEGNWTLERRLHAHFWEHRSHFEWFKPVPQLLTFIDALRSGEKIENLLDMAIPIKTLTRKAARNYPDATRLRVSYQGRLRWAFWNLNTQTRRFEPPQDVVQIMERWCGHGGKPCQYPSVEEFARLEAVIANPHLYAETAWSAEAA